MDISWTLAARAKHYPEVRDLLPMIDLFKGNVKEVGRGQSESISRPSNLQMRRWRRCWVVNGMRP